MRCEHVLWIALLLYGCSDPPPIVRVADAGPAAALCGDTILDPRERCEGFDVRGESCAAHGYLYGQATCTSSCTIDLSGCFGRCGDGVIDPGEACEPGLLVDMSCESLGYYPGPLGCGADCRYATASCGRCGDGVVQGDEECDGAVAQTCVDRGLVGGVLSCDEHCRIDEHACDPAPLAARFMSVDFIRFSPSGDRLIYRESPPTGETRWSLRARRISDGETVTIHEPYQTAPSIDAFSPDGTRWVYATFTGSRSLVVHVFDFTRGQDRLLSAGVSVISKLIFSPDSRHLSYVTHAGNGVGALNIIDLDTFTSTAAPGDISIWPESAAFTSDSGSVLYVTDRDDNGRPPSGTLRRFDLRTGQSSVLDRGVVWLSRQDPETLDGLHGLHVSPDRKHLAYFRACVDFICAFVDRDLDTGITTTIADEAWPYATRLAPSWSHYAFVKPGPRVAVRDRVTNAEIELPEGLAMGPVTYSIAQVTFSADSAWGVYGGVLPATTNHSSLYLIDLAHGSVAAIAPPVSRTAYAPIQFTSRALFYERRSNAPSLAHDLYVVDLATQRSQLIAANIEPRYVIGDGERRIAFQVGREISVFDRASEMTTVLSSDLFRRDWTSSPDRRWMLYVSRDDDLWAFDLRDGGAPVLLARGVNTYLPGPDRVAVTAGPERRAYFVRYPR